MAGPPRTPICWRSSARLGVLLASALVAGQEASAQEAGGPAASDCLESRECVDMVQSGRRLSESNQLNAALQTYESAYAQWRSPWLLINIGRIQQKLGRPAEAITTYQIYFDRAAGDSPARMAAARDYLKQAQSDLAASRKGAAPEKPIYKRWWLWTTVGGAVALAAAITAVAVVGTRAAEEAMLPANTFMFMF